ncbi:MAG: hypothetical protein SNJ85_07085 [Cyanobacteriota bacterium]
MDAKLVVLLLSILTYLGKFMGAATPPVLSSTVTLWGVATD